MCKYGLVDFHLSSEPASSCTQGCRGLLESILAVGLEAQAG